jgi:RHS repeat-associated protein
MKKSYITALLLLLFFTSNAQNLRSKFYLDTLKIKGISPNLSSGGNNNGYIPEVIPPSPNAASLGKFGDISLNLSSGLFNLPIPLYTATERSISVPIGLQYRYTGFRPSEDGGVCGRGWSLFAGGVITRSQKGAWQDEKIIDASAGQGGYLTSGVKTAQVINPQTGIFSCTGSNCPLFGNFLDLYDGEPDMFHFSADNISGKFFFGTDGLPKIVSDQKLKIEYVWKKSTTYLFGMSSQNLTHFTITSEDGTIYRFGFTGNRPINVDFAVSTSEHIITAWHLYEIESQTGEKVTFSYTNDHVSTTEIMKIHASLSMTQNYVHSSDGGDNQEQTPQPFLSRSAETFLKTIEGSNWKVELTHQEFSQPFLINNIAGFNIIKQLQSLKISTKTNPLTTLESYDFTYNTTDNKGLLTSIQPRDSQGNIAVPAHTFEYYDTVLPTNIYASSINIDFWNYYNGASNTTLLPQFGSNRNPDLASTRIGALKKITYPTGGNSEFEYELNEFGYIRENAITNPRLTIGGLRVSKITDTPLVGLPVVKQYEYNDFGNTARSSGIVSEVILPFSLNIALNVSCDGTFCPLNNTVNYTLFKSEPYYQMSRESVYYYNVREIKNGGSRSDHVFTSHFDFPDFLGHAYGFDNASIGPVSSRDFGRSLPKSTKLYKNLTELISEKKYQYTLSDRYLAPTLYLSVAFVRTQQNQTFTFSKGLNTYSGWLKKTGETDIYYNGTTALITNTQHEYNNSTYLQLSKTTTTESKADRIFVENTLTDSRVIETEYGYPYDFLFDFDFNAMKSKNIIAPVVAKTVSLYEPISASGLPKRTPIAYEKTTYRQFGNAYLPQKITTRVGDGILITPIIFNSYDARGNLTKFTTRSGQITTLAYYGSTDLGKTDLLKTYTVGGGSTGTVLSRSMSYDYKPLVGLLSATDLNGYTITNTYDAFNRLMSVKDPLNYLLKDFRYHYANETNPTGIGVNANSELNFVLSRIARTEQTGTALSNSVDLSSTQLQYMDGLGRGLQTLLWRASPDKTKDILSSTMIYDAYGRAYKSILPTPSNEALGVYKPNAQTLASTFYDGDTYPFTETIFESSPLNRPLRQFGAGQAWRTVNNEKFVAMEYQIEGAGVWQFDVRVNGGVNAYLNYPDNSLYKNVSTSERGFQTKELKDRQGRVTHKIQQLSTDTLAITGYCYNNLGQLSYVIPPEAYKKFGTTINSFTEDDELFKELIFAYHYDNLGRVSEKHIPGAGWRYSVYDQQDHEVMFADEEDKAKGYWKFRKFDALGREIQNGILNGSGSTSREALQTAFDDFTGKTYEESSNTGLLGYTNTSFPSTYTPVEADIMSVIHYDNYDWQTETAYDFNALTAFHTQGLAKGMMTGMLSRNIETNAWLKTVNYYDYRGKLIQSFFKNHKGNIERSETLYRFNGEVLKMNLAHENITEIYDYEIDHAGRKTSFKHTLNGILKNVSQYQYDELGRLKTKKLSPFITLSTVASGSWNNTNTWQNNGLPSINDYIRINAGHSVTIDYGEAGSAGSLFNAGTLNTIGQLKLGVLPPNTSGATELQTVDYSYHIRGLRGINLDASGNLTNKLFSMRLGYEDAGFWDGNIGKQEWKSSLDNVTRSFTYGYDGNSRIKSGIYGSTKAGENYSLNNVTYDFNGNITNLSRNGWKSDNTFGLVDNLNYTYNSNSNKILKVDDASNETASFKDASGNDYTYSLDGSLTSDANKGISVIEYNYLKLPRRVVQNGVTTLYQYSASGAKLREIIGTDTTDYLGNIIKKNGVLYQISHDEGRIINGEYEYNIKDHLGNLRVAFRDSLGIAKITQANSYGIWGEDLPTLSYLKQTWKVDKFKFTGKEELSETGYIDFGARLYDNLAPRFITIDPLAEKWNLYSPYSYAMNNPISNIDPDGRDIIVSYHQGDETKTYTYAYEKDRKFDKNTPDFLKNTIQALDHLYTNKALNVTVGEGKDAKTVNVLETIIGDKENHLSIKEGEASKYRSVEKTIYFATDQAGGFMTDLTKDEFDATNSPSSILGHEMLHNYNDTYDNSGYTKRKADKSTNSGNYGDFPNAEEKYVTTNLGNQMNIKLGEPTRNNYASKMFPAVSPTSNKRKK